MRWECKNKQEQAKSKEKSHEMMLTKSRQLRNEEYKNARTSKKRKKK
jgi:hypothetical protein